MSNLGNAILVAILDLIDPFRASLPLTTADASVISLTLRYTACEWHGYLKICTLRDIENSAPRRKENTITKLCR